MYIGPGAMSSQRRAKLLDGPIPMPIEGMRASVSSVILRINRNGVNDLRGE